MLFKKASPKKEDASSSATHSLFYFTFLFYVFISLRNQSIFALITIRCIVANQ